MRQTIIGESCHDIGYPSKLSSVIAYNKVYRTIVDIIAYIRLTFIFWQSFITVSVTSKELYSTLIVEYDSVSCAPQSPHGVMAFKFFRLRLICMGLRYLLTIKLVLISRLMHIS